MGSQTLDGALTLAVPTTGPEAVMLDRPQDAEAAPNPSRPGREGLLRQGAQAALRGTWYLRDKLMNTVTM